MNNIRPGGTDATGGNMGALCAADFGGGNLVMSGTEIRQPDSQGVQNRINFLASFSPTGEQQTRYCENKTFYNYNDMKFIEREHTPSFWWGFTVDGDGNVYVAADRDAYAISVYKPDGTLDRVIEREFEPYQRTESEKQRMHDMINSAIGDVPFKFQIIVEDREPVIDFFHHGLRVDDDGNLWVTTSRGLRDHTDGAMMTYDVFDPDGHFSKQVAVACEGDSYYDCLFWVSEDQVVLVTGAMAALAAQFGGGATLDSDDEEATPQAVICYNVKRSRQTN
jgi:sugar lactone lactonase YvrE